MSDPKFPEEIQCRITDEFLITFKEELERIFFDSLPKKPTYWNYYQWFDNTGGFHTALERACDIHNFMELYEYLENEDYSNSDILNGSLTEMLYERNLIKEGSSSELYYLQVNPFIKIKHMVILFIYNIKHYIMNSN